MRECVICHEYMDSKTEILSCQHAFHPSCISKWILCKQGGTCPLCRQIPMQMTQINLYRKAIISISVPDGLSLSLITTVLMVYECNKHDSLQQIIYRYAYAFNMLKNNFFKSNLKRSSVIIDKYRKKVTLKQLRDIFKWFETTSCYHMKHDEFNKVFEKIIKHS